MRKKKHLCNFLMTVVFLNRTNYFAVNTMMSFVTFVLAFFVVTMSYAHKMSIAAASVNNVREAKDGTRPSTSSPDRHIEGSPSDNNVEVVRSVAVNIAAKYGLFTKF